MFPFTVLTHPTSDIRNPALLLHNSSGDRYVFGKIPEGLQRTLTETKTRISKVDGVFLTGELNWQSLGGLPGLILTISDQGKKDLNLFYGNNYLDYVISTWRSFVFRFGINLNSTILSTEQVFTNDMMNIKAINLLQENVKENKFDEVTINKLKNIVSRMFPLDVKNTYTEEENKKFEELSDPKLSDPYIHVNLPNFKPVQTSTCYSIKMKGVRGKFSVEKAAALGVPKGKIRGELASGKNITLEDGTIIKPEQVLSESREFDTVLIIDIPNNSYLNSALNYQWDEKTSIVYHFLGEEIEPFSDNYISFIKSFNQDCYHYISHPLYCPDSIIFKSSANIGLKLKALQPTHFNLAKSYAPENSIPNTLPNNVDVLLQGQITTIESTIPSIRNKITFDQSEVAIRTSNDWEDFYIREVLPLNFKPSFPKEQILNEDSVASIKIDPSKSLRDQVEITTLGTGSALPSKYRNVISNLIRIPFEDENGSFGFKSVLLDAGENTIGTIYRTFGKEFIPTLFKELNMIYLSHLHADHHLGIISIITEWLKHNEDNDKKLYLVTPWQYNTFVEEWLRFEGCINPFDRLVYISCEQFLSGKKRFEIESIPFDEFLTKQIQSKENRSTFAKNDNKVSNLFYDVGITKFNTCRAIHCDWSYCCSITFKLNSTENFKISYSGDTRPNFYMFAEIIGQNSDLLIHEATLENDLLEEAKKKRHSTINEAIEISNKMNSKKLILTHFSQRYPKLPAISKRIQINSEYCFAFDSMINKYGDIGDQENLIGQLNKAFIEEKKKDDEEIESD